MTYCGICGRPENEVKVHKGQGFDICSECKKPRTRENHLHKKYNMSLSEYDTLFEQQDGVCAICGDSPNTKRLFVDHCHKTGKIRGLLCGRCNSMLGFAKDSISNLASAIKYLEKN